LYHICKKEVKLIFSSSSHSLGLGLGGIVSSLCGADETVITDYPAQVLLENLEKNVEVNVPAHVASRPVVTGHEWGVLDDEFSEKNKGRFTKVLAAGKANILISNISNHDCHADMEPLDKTAFGCHGSIRI